MCVVVIVVVIQNDLYDFNNIPSSRYALLHLILNLFVSAL